MHVEAGMVRHYQPDTGACVRAILALLAIPTKDADRSSPATVESGRAEPAKKTPAPRSIARRRARAKAAHPHAARP
jgi:hypothetical protein